MKLNRHQRRCLIAEQYTGELKTRQDFPSVIEPVRFPYE